MESTIRISFSAVTHKSSAYLINEDRIFANGKFLSPSVTDYAQISLETNDSKCFFALSENMEDEEAGISLTSDLKKFHQKAMTSSKDIHVKLDELVQCVEQSSNLIHSFSLGEGDIQERNPSFAGILINEGHIAAVNMGNSRIYKLEGDTFKLLVNDHKRAERLLKMGIISSEQAEILTARQQSAMGEGRSTVKKSDVNPLREGTVYLICSNGLAEAVSEDSIYDILCSNADSDEAAGRLVEEALKNEPEESITALVIKIESTDEIHVPVPSPRAMQYRPTARASTPSRQVKVAASRHRRSVDVSKIVAIVVLVVLASAVILGGYKLWRMAREPKAQNVGSEQENSLGISDSTYESSTIDDSEDDSQDGGLSDEDPDASDEPDNGESTDTQSDSWSDLGVVDGYYTVKSGDMLMTLAKKFYGDESKYVLIMKANNITDANKITVGQKLKIPPADE